MSMQTFHAMRAARAMLPVVVAGQDIEVSGIRFHPGSVVSYAMKHKDCPIEAIDQARERGEKTHWLNGVALVISNPPTIYETPRVRIAFGDRVVFEGRIFEVTRAPNRNASLREIDCLDWIAEVNAADAAS